MEARVRGGPGAVAMAMGLARAARWVAGRRCELFTSALLERHGIWVRDSFSVGTQNDECVAYLFEIV